SGLQRENMPAEAGREILKLSLFLVTARLELPRGDVCVCVCVSVWVCGCVYLCVCFCVSVFVWVQECDYVQVCTWVSLCSVLADTFVIRFSLLCVLFTPL